MTSRFENHFRKRITLQNRIRIDNVNRPVNKNSGTRVKVWKAVDQRALPGRNKNYFPDRIPIRGILRRNQRIVRPMANGMLVSQNGRRIAHGDCEKTVDISAHLNPQAVGQTVAIRSSLE
jgi:hypothetical protein